MSRSKSYKWLEKNLVRAHINIATQQTTSKALLGWLIGRQWAFRSNIMFRTYQPHTMKQPARAPRAELPVDIALRRSEINLKKTVFHLWQPVRVWFKKSLMS